MKSPRVIPVLFLLSCLLCSATFIYANDSDTKNKTTELDSLLDRYQDNDAQLSKATAVTRQYEDMMAKGYELQVDDFERLAIQYGVLLDTARAIHYADLHIKNAYDPEILEKQELAQFKGHKAYDRLYSKYMPEINGWILFFFSTGLLGIFISVILNLRKKGDTVANLLISGFVLIHSLFMIHLSLFYSKYNFGLPHTLYTSTLFSFLYGPLIYFYFRRIRELYRFKMIDLLHLAPTILLLLFFLPIYMKSAEEKTHLLYNRDEILHWVLTMVVVLKAISLSIYGYLIFRIYMKNTHKGHPEIKTWKRNILILNSFYVVTYLIYGLALIMYISGGLFIYPQTVAMCVLVLYVAYTAYVQPRVFSKKYIFDELGSKYEKSGLTPGFSVELQQQLLTLLKQDKVYRDNTLNLNTLSEQMGTTRHNLSQVINEHFSMNFFNLINKFRIEEAREILRNDINKNLNIIDVAYDVGFNNKVTFNKAFKEETSLTPTQYIKSLRTAPLRVNFK